MNQGMSSDGLIEITFQNVALNKRTEDEFLNAFSPLPVIRYYRILETIGFDAIIIAVGLLVAKGFFEEAGKDLWRKLRPAVQESVKSRGGLSLKIRFRLDVSVEAIVRVNQDASEADGSFESLKEITEFLEKRRADIKQDKVTFLFNPKTKKWEMKDN